MASVDRDRSALTSPNQLEEQVNDNNVEYLSAGEGSEGKVLQSIDLDCPPGGIRPWDLIEGVVKDTIIVLTDEDKEPGHTFFGHRRWEFDIPRDVWVEQVQPVIKPRIEKLYREGTIRYGSW